MAKNSNKNLLPYWIMFLWISTVLVWWAFAFMPIPDQSPEWFLKARAVCFGSMPNGLPEDYGWMLLIGGPLMLLSVIYVLWGTEIISSIKASFESLPLNLLSIILVVCLGAEFVLVQNKISQAIQNKESLLIPLINALPENYPVTDKPASDFILVNQNGESVSLKSLRGKTVYLSFAFSHCQTMCPTLVHNLKAAISDPLMPAAWLVMVTLDPWRDTPSSLPTLAKNWGFPENAWILSGQPEAVSKVLNDYEVPRSRSSENGDIIHPAITHVISPKGQLIYTLNNASTEVLKEAARRASTY